MTIWSNVVAVEGKKKISETILRWLQIDILVVTDTIVSFGPEHDPRNLNEDNFGMSYLIGVLEQVGSVTKAHRQIDPLNAPGVKSNFRFDQEDLSRYDQIWLLGYGSGVLPESEQAAITDFMEKGGGVFATGDHESIGSALAGDLPRIRSMRHWQSPPPALGADRVDTVRPDANDIVVFENQSDDIPQVLRLKWYQWAKSRWSREIYPHPLLCGRSGPITEFPDHMHEGEVVVPPSLEDQMTLNKKTFDEYPKDTTGNRVSPEVVAWGFTTGRADPEVMTGIHVGDPQASIPRWTGTIGMYDGRKVGVGRVVVHSTFHHFFDINLIGDNATNRPGFNDPRAPLWRKGFTASPNGQRILSQLSEYYRNIVHWLSPDVGLVRFNALIVQLAMSHHIREVLEVGNISALKLGAYAWEYAVRYYPPCTIFELSSIAIPEVTPVWPWENPVPTPDIGPNDIPIQPWPIPPKQIAQAALGGALLEFARIESVDEINEEYGIERLRFGALEGIKLLIEDEYQAAKVGLKQLEIARGHLKNCGSSST